MFRTHNMFIFVPGNTCIATLEYKSTCCQCSTQFDDKLYKLKIESLFFLLLKRQKKRIQTIQLGVHQLLMAEVSMPRLIANVSLNSKICFLKIAIAA